MLIDTKHWISVINESKNIHNCTFHVSLSRLIWQIDKSKNISKNQLIHSFSATSSTCANHTNTLQIRWNDSAPSAIVDIMNVRCFFCIVLFSQNCETVAELMLYLDYLWRIIFSWIFFISQSTIRLWQPIIIKNNQVNCFYWSTSVAEFCDRFDNFFLIKRRFFVQISQ